MSQTTCPVLRPTLEEFKDFKKFLSTIEKPNHQQSGIIKIIPPEGWFAADYRNVDDIIFKPVKQRAVVTEAGAYSLMLEDMPEMSVSAFKAYADINKSKVEGPEAREKQFWRELGKSNGNEWGDRMYGADLANVSLFGEEKACGWNLSNLDSTLRLIGCDVPGVSSSMLYIGMYSSLFPFHVEDCDLYSINYLHIGEPKSWYCVPPAERTRFESLARSMFPQDSSTCKEFLRHKASIISPSTLRSNGITLTKAVQEAGEFIVTFPGSYHGGYNQGFNIAEATNFATPSWISIGCRAGVCQCNPDAVSINMELFQTLYLRSQNFLGKSPIITPKNRKFHCACGTIMNVGDLGCWVWPAGQTKKRTFECGGCRCWAHLDCIYDDKYKPAPSERLLCHICHDLENKPPPSVKNLKETAIPNAKQKSKKLSSVKSTGKSKGTGVVRRDDDSELESSSDDDTQTREAPSKGKGDAKVVSKKRKVSGEKSSSPPQKQKARPIIRKRLAVGDMVSVRGRDGEVMWVDTSECCVRPVGGNNENAIIVDFLVEEVTMIKRAQA